MTHNRPRLLLIPAVLVALVALVIAGCGGNGGAATAASKPKTMSGSSATVGVSDNSSLGKILVDSQGRTVYLFKKDTGPMSTCSGACATEWPPVTSTTKPTAGNGATGSMLGTTKRSDGSTQVTYNGHPLYRYVGDAAAGDTNGQNLDFFGGKWYVLSPAGTANTSGGSGNGSSY
jgi:predicted lipoprotein with Yx(FWY)xxD motif